MPPDSRTPLVLISGLAPTPATEFAERFLARPGTAVVEYNLRQVTEGVVTRRLRLGVPGATRSSTAFVRAAVQVSGSLPASTSTSANSTWEIAIQEMLVGDGPLGLGIGHAGPWLASEDGPGWENVTDERRTLASLRWDPRFGDRAQELVIVAHRTTSTEIETALTDALLTDAELAAGEQAWLRYPDPFGEWHTDPCEDSQAQVPDNRTDATRTDEQ